MKHEQKRHSPSRVLRTCECCGREFTSRGYLVRKGGARFCSLHCSSRTRPQPPLALTPDRSTALVPLRARDGSIRDYALIDSEDADWVNEYRWSLNADGYAHRCQRIDGVDRTIWLHREVLGLPRISDGRVGDHIDLNRLNNRRQNLRIIPKAVNQQNTGSRPGSSSAFRGVSWYPRYGKWVARLTVNRKTKTVGYFTDEREAANAASDARRTLMPYASDSQMAVAR